MKVYIVLDAPPAEWGEGAIKSVHLSRATATGEHAAARVAEKRVESLMDARARQMREGA